MTHFNFSLETDETLQGTFSPKKLNLLLTFQVNCPGCFIYAFPVMNTLYTKFKDELGFLGISTAFEDFDKNTLENTKMLLKHGELIGETKKSLATHGINKLPYELNFPIVMDKIIHQHEISEEDKADIKHTLLGKLQGNLRDDTNSQLENYLNSFVYLPQTFLKNAMNGTPTFTLLDKEFKIINQWFGHVLAETLENAIFNELT